MASPTTYRYFSINDKPPTPVDAGVHGDIQFDPNDSAPTFIGLNLTKGASDSDPNWKIYKFFYTGVNVIRIQLAYGAWADRAIIF